MRKIARTAVIIKRDTVEVGKDVSIMDYAIIGLPNYYQGDFQNEKQRRVVIGDRARIYPFTVVFEGASLGSGVIMEERTSVGSRTRIGAKTRILYQAQVNDDVTIGKSCIIGGFVADNTRVGNRCKVFGALVHRCETKNWDTEGEDGPIIEDDVFIGWGSIVVGKVKIGTGAHIPPNVLVRQNVPPGKKYAGRRK